jgi:teichuronic acid exporter
MGWFSSSILTVLRGSIVAQAIGFLVLPLLSRLFPPDAFGVVQGLTSVLSLLLIVSVLRLEIAILSVTDDELPTLLSCGFWLCIFTSAAVCVGTVVWTCMSDVGAGALGHALHVLPLLALLSGWGLLLHYLALRGKGFALNANAKIAHALAANGTAASIGAVQPQAWGLALADAAGRLANVLVLGRGLLSAPRQILRFPAAGAFKAVFARHRSLWAISLPGALINAAGSAFTAPILLVLFSAHDAGQYALVERSIGMPIGMLAAAASQVFMAGFAEAGRSGDGRRQVLRDIASRHFKLGILPAIALFLVAPVLVPLVFGDAWEAAGRYAQALVPLYLVAFIVGPLNMALTLADKQVHQLAWDVARLGVIAGVWMIIIVAQLPTLTALWLYSGAACVCYLAYLVLADRVLADSREPRP